MHFGKCKTRTEINKHIGKNVFIWIISVVRWRLSQSLPPNIMIIWVNCTHFIKIWVLISFKYQDHWDKKVLSENGMISVLRSSATNIILLSQYWDHQLPISLGCLSTEIISYQYYWTASVLRSSAANIIVLSQYWDH